MSLTRDRTTWVSYAQGVCMGWFICGFGAVLPFVQAEQHLSATALALHGLALGLGATLSGLTGGQIVARIGRGKYLRIASLLLGLGIATFLVAHVLALTLLGAFVSMFGGGAIAQSTATYLQSHHGNNGAAALTEMHGIIAGVGVISPVLVGVAVAAQVSWRIPYTLPLVALVLVELARGRDIAQYGQAGRTSESVAHHDAPGPLPALFRWTLVTMACTASIEFCVALWASNLLRDQGGLGNAAAAASLGCIYGGMFVSRVVVARIAVHMDTQPIYAASLAVSLLAFAIFWSSHSSVVMVIALLATGLAIAPHFPLGMTRSMVASDGRQDRAAAGALAMSGFASGVSPFALGALADRIGIHSAYGIVPMAILIALVVTLYRPIHAHATDS